LAVGIKDDVRSIVYELDVDGGGYQTAEAANLLVHRYVLAGVCLGDGQPKPEVRALMRLGAGVAFKGYKSDKGDEQKFRQAAAAGFGDQRDFVELADDFDFQWLRDYAAGDEGEGASRKMMVRMTLSEVLAVIALKRKKAAEAIAVANDLQYVVDANPHWYDHPYLTIADILGIHE